MYDYQYVCGKLVLGVNKKFQSDWAKMSGP